MKTNRLCGGERRLAFPIFKTSTSRPNQPGGFLSSLRSGRNVPWRAPNTHTVRGRPNTHAPRQTNSQSLASGAARSRHVLSKGRWRHSEIQHRMVYSSSWQGSERSIRRPTRPCRVGRPAAVSNMASTCTGASEQNISFSPWLVTSPTAEWSLLVG